MMGALDPTIASIIVALAVGLLIGLDRERHKRAEMPQTAAGLRTFALSSLLGVMAAIAASGWLLLVVGAGVVALVSQSYRRTQRLHPGQTTEFALLATFAIGYLAASHVGLAAGLGVCVAILLNAKSRLHRFALTQLSEQELHDALLLAAAALIVLPLLPDHAIDPYGVFNPQVVWRLTVIILSVHALGYVARRTLGARTCVCLVPTGRPASCPVPTWFGPSTQAYHRRGAAWTARGIRSEFVPKEDQAEFNVRVRAPLGSSLARTDAIMGLARHIGGKARFAPLLRFIPRPVRDFLYDRIALNRYTLFGKLDACMAPDAGTRARFTLQGDGV